MSEPTEAMKQAFADGAKAHEAVHTERAILKTRSGIAPNHGVMLCPVCLIGELRWQFMPNGHLHMHCTKIGCVQWIE